MSETQQIERIKTWLAGRYQDHHIYRGKPKLLAKHAQELLDEVVDPMLTGWRSRAQGRQGLLDQARTENLRLRAELAGLRAENTRWVEQNERIAEERDEARRVVAQVNNNHGDFASGSGPYTAINWARATSVPRLPNGKPDVSAKLIEVLISTHVNSDGTAGDFPVSIATLADEAGLTYDATRRAIERLRAAGLLYDVGAAATGCREWLLPIERENPPLRDARTEREEARRATDRIRQQRRREQLRQAAVTQQNTVTVTGGNHHSLPEPAAPAMSDDRIEQGDGK